MLMSAGQLTSQRPQAAQVTVCEVPADATGRKLTAEIRLLTVCKRLRPNGLLSWTVSAAAPDAPVGAAKSPTLSAASVAPSATTLIEVTKLTAPVLRAGVELTCNETPPTLRRKAAAAVALVMTPERADWAAVAPAADAVATVAVTVTEAAATSTDTAPVSTDAWVAKAAAMAAVCEAVTDAMSSAASKEVVKRCSVTPMRPRDRVSW